MNERFGTASEKGRQTGMNYKKVFTGLVLLVLGGMVYVLFRPRTLRLFALADAIGLGGTLDKWRQATEGCMLPDFVLYSLPSGLWTASYLLIIDSMFRHLPLRQRLRWASIIPTIGLGSELMQGAGVLPGTYDVSDLLCYLIPFAIYLIVLKSEMP